MNKRVYIVHAWGAKPKDHWYGWLAQMLNQENFHVTVLEMPDTDVPRIDPWVSYLDRIVGNLDRDTYFVGHSIGCQTILRYLMKQRQKVGGAVFVAGWFFLKNLESKEEEEIAAPWLRAHIDYEDVKKVLKKCTVFLSDNDLFDCVEENKEVFEEKLGYSVVVEHAKGHFTGDDGVHEVPEVLGELLKFSR